MNDTVANGDRRNNGNSAEERFKGLPVICGGWWFGRLDLAGARDGEPRRCTANAAKVRAPQQAGSEARHAHAR